MFKRGADNPGGCDMAVTVSRQGPERSNAGGTDGWMVRVSQSPGVPRPDPGRRYVGAWAGGISSPGNGNKVRCLSHGGQVVRPGRRSWKLPVPFVRPVLDQFPGPPRGGRAWKIQYFLAKRESSNETRVQPPTPSGGIPSSARTNVRGNAM